MNAKQRRRLNSVLGSIRATPLEASPVLREASEALTKAATEGASSRRKVKGSVKLKATLADGKLDVSIPPQHPSFKVYDVPNYKYTVTSKDGRNIELNTYSRAMEFIGDKVLGVPPILKSYKTASNEELADAMLLSFNGIKKGVSLKVDPEQHNVHKGDLNPDKGYMGWQIHHVDQWYKNPPQQVEADFKAGKITEEQRRQLYRDNLRPNPERLGEYEIAPLPVGKRAFVLLPGGQHELQTPLFNAVHPPTLHPDTGKWKTFGIPQRDKDVKAARDDGESREWYNARFRPPFWKEYYKTEAKTIAVEINRRLATGALSEDDAKKLLSLK